MTTKAKPDTEEKAPPRQDPLDEIAELLAAAVGADPKAAVYLIRYNDQGKEEHLRRYRPDEFDVEAVRETYGGGDYRARAKTHKGQWLPGSVGFSIAGTPRLPADDPPPAHRAAASSAEDVTELRRMIEDLRAELRHGGGGRDNPIDTAAAFAQAGVQQFAALVELMGMKQPNTDGGLSADRLLEVFRMGMEMGQERGGGGDGTASAFDSLASMFGKAIEARGHPSAATPVATSPAPKPDPQPLQAAVAELVRYFDEGGRNPEARAAILAEQIPALPELLAREIERFGGADKALDALSLALPAVGRHRELFARAVAELVEWSSDADQDDGGDDA
jgi:hypothetical protein